MAKTVAGVPGVDVVGAPVVPRDGEEVHDACPGVANSMVVAASSFPYWSGADVQVGRRPASGVVVVEAGLRTGKIGGVREMRTEEWERKEQKRGGGNLRCRRNPRWMAAVVAELRRANPWQPGGNVGVGQRGNGEGEEGLK